MNKPSTYALSDCNNFYVSCERVFNPKLSGKPVVILSNNDGCIVSRSNEAKALGIPMGAPYFKWKPFCRRHHVTVLSSNYALYANMSERVMNLFEQLCPDIEFYSIDEAFLNLKRYDNPVDYATYIRQIVLKWTGIPVSIGLAPTKTLAKAANYIAKKRSGDGIFDLTHHLVKNKILSDFPVEQLWGVGQSTAKKLALLNITTAKALMESDPKYIRKHFSVVMERMVLELRGISCLTLASVQPKKQIICSRSFGKVVENLIELEEAVSYYTASACIKLREEGRLASGIYVFLQRNVFSPTYNRDIQGSAYQFPKASDDTRYINQIAKKCLESIYKSGQRYHKAGIILLDLVSSKTVQHDLFLNNQHERSDRLMKTVDSINEKLGTHTLFYASEGIKKAWKMHSDHRSARYTTDWNELPLATA